MNLAETETLHLGRVGAKSMDARQRPSDAGTSAVCERSPSRHFASRVQPERQATESLHLSRTTAPVGLMQELYDSRLRATHSLLGLNGRAQTRSASINRT